VQTFLAAVAEPWQAVLQPVDGPEPSQRAMCVLEDLMLPASEEQMFSDPC